MKLNNNNSIYLQPLRLFPCPWASGARTDWWRQSPASPASHHSNRSAAAWCSPPAASENSAYSSKILVTCLVFRCVNKKIKYIYIYIYVYVVFAVRWISFERDFVGLNTGKTLNDGRWACVQERCASSGSGDVGIECDVVWHVSDDDNTDHLGHDCPSELLEAVVERCVWVWCKDCSMAKCCESDWKRLCLAKCGWSPVVFFMCIAPYGMSL